MKIAVSKIIVMSLALACAAPAWAGAAVAQDIVAGDSAKALAATWPLAATGHLEIGNVRGKVEVTGWDQAQVKLEGTLGAGSTLAVSGGSDNLSLRVKGGEAGWFGTSGPRSDSNLVLHVPRAAVLEVHVVSADARLADVAGATLKIESVSGDLVVATSSPEIDIDSVSGEVKLDAPSPNASARAHVQTVSGDVQARNLAGRIKLETVSGNLTCACAATSDLDGGSVSGDLDITAAPASGARVNLESMSGDIALRLPASVSAVFDVSTVSGSIRSDFGEVRDEEYGAGSSLKAQLGNADAQIKVQSFSGDVQLRKQ